MRRVLVVSLAVLIVAVILSSAFLLRRQHPPQSSPSYPVGGFAEDAPFYVGVTYCGNSTEEAKFLIDRVKNYTNLFVLQSGSMQTNINSMNEVCEYAASSGLNIVVYFGSNEYQNRYVRQFLDGNMSWRNKLVGVYFGDEPGGKMLDTNVELYDPKTGDTAIKHAGTRVTLTKADGTLISYSENGLIVVFASTKHFSANYHSDGRISLTTGTTQNRAYYMIEKNGTVYMVNQYGNEPLRVEDTSGLPKLETYETLMAERPFQNYDEAAQRLVNECKDYNDWLHSHWTLKSITSDYGLYWWDNLGEYDTVLAELGWNNTVAQEIALARGAANLQGKDWGTIITWKYTTEPYLTNGEEMYQQMRTSYQAGAKYILIFNYAEDMQGPYGTLEDNHFNALERFWREVVQNPNVTRGGTKAEAALVLPMNYGWGLRRSNDTIWGLWKPDDKSPQVWASLQDSSGKHGSKLDIVYDDPLYPVAGKYTQIIYWNQTG